MAKILYVTGSFPPMKCGVGDYTRKLASKVAEHGNFKVFILTSERAGQGPWPGMSVFPLMRKWSFYEIKTVLGFFRTHRPDIVHIQYPTYGYGKAMMPSFLPRLLDREGVPVIQTWHDPLSWKGWFRYLPNTMSGDILIVVEQDYRSFLPSFYNRMLNSKKKIFIPVASNIPKAVLTEKEKKSIRTSFGCLSKRMVVYFGFVSPAKGVEQVFQVGDPDSDRVVLVAELFHSNRYHRKIIEMVAKPSWAGKAFVTGFLPAEEVALLLAASDVAVFPFPHGVNDRNASVLAARIQNTFVLTTHKTKRGYDPVENVYYAEPGNITEMRKALLANSGRKATQLNEGVVSWDFIADEHLRLYSEVLKRQHSSKILIGDQA